MVCRVQVQVQISCPRAALTHSDSLAAALGSAYARCNDIYVEVVLEESGIPNMDNILYQYTLTGVFGMTVSVCRIVMFK